MKPLGSQMIAEFVDCTEDVLNDRGTLEHILAQGIKESGLTLISICGHQFDPVGVTVVAVIGESHVVIHTYPEARHASIDLFTCSNGSHAREDLLDYLKHHLAPRTVRIVNLDRGNPLEVRDKNWITSFSSSGYETRYHIDKLLFSKRSRFQQIDIIENETFGRMLFLDKDLQIAEHDSHIYNKSLVSPIADANGALRGRGRVAILGGGDGGVLSEVAAHEVESVTLVDIDRDVVDASKAFLTSIHRGAFDRPNVMVRIQDANVFLDTERGFDVIIYDLTMHPEALTCTERKTFLKDIFSKIQRSLVPGGAVSMQCCSEFDIETRETLVEMIPVFFDDLEFRTSFIPSFCERWLFATATARVTSQRESATARLGHGLPR